METAMESHSFDRLTKALTERPSRRNVARGLIGGLFGLGVHSASAKQTKVIICHKGQTIEVAEPAVKAHLAHGDSRGACCRPACGTGLVCCDGVCVDLQHDAANCGACGAACPEEGACESPGVCTCPSSSVSEPCGGVCCIDGGRNHCCDDVCTPVDGNNCRFCGDACPTGNCLRTEFSRIPRYFSCTCEIDADCPDGDACIDSGVDTLRACTARCPDGRPECIASCCGADEQCIDGQCTSADICPNGIPCPEDQHCCGFDTCVARDVPSCTPEGCIGE